MLFLNTRSCTYFLHCGLKVLLLKEVYYFSADGKKKRFLERTDDIRPEDYEQGMIPNQWEGNWSMNELEIKSQNPSNKLYAC